MSTLPAQYLASQKAALNAFVEFQNTAFNGFEQLVDLNLRVTRATLDELARKAQDAVEVKDVQQAFAFSSGAVQPGADKALAYNKQVYDILTAMQSKFVQLAEHQLSEARKQVHESFEEIAQRAPAGSETALALTRSVLASANSAYDSVAKAARQAAVVAESNLSAVANASFEAANKAARPQ